MFAGTQLYILVLSYLCSILPFRLILLLIPTKILYAYLLPHARYIESLILSILDNHSNHT